jgi:hypothetical protein
MDTERSKTISKNFYDDEIIGKTEAGDLILKIGVKRLNYDDHIDPDQLESHINYSALSAERMQRRREREQGTPEQEEQQQEI